MIPSHISKADVDHCHLCRFLPPDYTWHDAARPLSVNRTRSCRFRFLSNETRFLRSAVCLPGIRRNMFLQCPVQHLPQTAVRFHFNFTNIQPDLKKPRLGTRIWTFSTSSRTYLSLSSLTIKNTQNSKLCNKSVLLYVHLYILAVEF